MSDPSTPRRREGGKVHRRYFKSIRRHTMTIDRLADAALDALAVKQFDTARVLIIEIAKEARGASHLALEALADLEPNERSEDI